MPFWVPLRLKRVLIGQDPREVERICHELYRDSYWRVGPVLQSAISALNIAMWDIKAKALQVPLYELLGGKVRDSVRMYANVWFAGAKEPDEFAAAAKKAVAMGVTALKWDPLARHISTWTIRSFSMPSRLWKRCVLLWAAASIC